MKKLMHGINIALNTLLAVLIFAVLAFLLAPRFGLVTPFEIKIVKSGSMAPKIPTGSVVLIQPETAYNVGDVITFGNDSPTSIPTSHRIVSERVQDGVTYYTTKGDANNAPDQNETPGDKIIGKVTYSLPAVGYILAFSKTQLGFTLLVLIPAALVILYELIGIVKEVQAMRKRKRDEGAVARLAAESREPPPRIPRRHTSMLHFDIETPIGWREQKIV